MISLAPIGTLDDGQGSASCCASVSQHPRIEAQMKDAITSVCSEWRKRSKAPSEVLDSSCPEARNLVVTIDRFMSNGCLRGDRLYWYFAKEFLTHSECESLVDEWRASNERDLSVAWLKDSLNKQSMPFIFQSFVLNWKLVLKHYSREAAIANRALIKRLANSFLEIADVRFHFSASSNSEPGVPVAEMRASVIFAGSGRPRSPHSRNGQETHHVVAEGSGLQDTPSATLVRSRLSRRRRSARSESTSRAIADVPLPPDFVETTPLMASSPYISSAKDYDYVFDQMLHRGERGLVACGSLPLLRGNRMANLSHQRSVESPPSYASLSEHSVRDGRRGIESVPTRCQDEAPVAEKPADPFDVALKMSISKAKLLAAARETDVKSRSRVPSPPVEFTPFGEVRLDMGEVVGLSIKVFRDEMEKFLKFYQIYVHFGTGQPVHRFFVLSDRAVYLLSLQCNLVSARKTYITCAYLPLRNVDFIAVGADYEVLYLNIVKGSYLEAEEGTRLDSHVMEVCTACAQLGRSMVDAISVAYMQCVSNTLPVYTDSTPQRLITTKFVAKELHIDNPTLECYCLAQWRQTRIDCAMGENVVQRSGFLYHKLVKSSSWLPYSGDYRQSFFHLQGKKLYQFEDSTCKVGERVVALQEMVSDVCELKGREQSAHMFQMELNNGEKYEFICASGSDLHQWVSLLNLALSTTDLDDEAVACVAVVSRDAILIAQEGLNCAVDGFMRLLVRIDLQHVQSAVGVLASERYACVLSDGQNLNWIFLRSPDEIDRFLAVLQRLGVNRISNEEDGSSRLTALLNSMPRSGDLFYFSDAHSDDAFEL
ncbi:Pleckstrin homology domain-containing family M member 2 [Toxocara canis]|uniref:Pleckstrin homology domain-containing family M member 2 n=1 Tax=Toxocara canis TaxID=6265 RepID=A0A0B2UVH7_TOXCA|nr:Pleckstrin homology domain-containing family M member 2 [Toxocara canis]